MIKLVNHATDFRVTDQLVVFQCLEKDLKLGTGSTYCFATLGGNLPKDLGAAFRLDGQESFFVAVSW